MIFPSCSRYTSQNWTSILRPVGASPGRRIEQSAVGSASNALRDHRFAKSDETA